MIESLALPADEARGEDRPSAASVRSLTAAAA
jgi:hypothetical protein